MIKKQDILQKTENSSAMQLVLARVRQAPGTLLRARDIEGTGIGAAARAFSRLAAQGVVIRQGKGLYYAPKETLLGRSRPSELSVLQSQLGDRARPTGTTAANLLGLSTQVSARTEVAVYATAKPRAAQAARVKLRRAPGGLRPLSAGLSETDAALLEFLRGRGNYSERSATETLERLRHLLLEEGKASSSSSSSSSSLSGSLPPMDRRERLERLTQAALQEPPRVRAMLGALLEWSGLGETLYRPLRESLNPLTRFDFGLLSALPNAKEWQSK